MAVLPGANRGARAAKDASGASALAPAFGVSATLALSATSNNIALPTDANGNLYPAYLFTTTQICYVAFATTNSDAAVTGAANNYLITGPGAPPVAIATPQAQLNGQVGAYVAAIASAAGNLCITGLY